MTPNSANAHAAPARFPFLVDGPCQEKLLATLASIEVEGGIFQFHRADGSPAPLLDAGLLYACDAAQEADAIAKQIHELANRLQGQLLQRGQRCEVSGLPVFVTLTHAHVPVNADWIESLEVQQETVRCQLADALAVAGKAAAHGFGSVELRIQTVLLNSDDSVPFMFRARALHQAMIAAAQEFLHRQTQQPVRLKRLVWGTVGALTGILILALWLGSVKWAQERSAPSRKARLERDSLLTHCRHAIEQARQLLHFEGYRPGPRPTTDWPRWYRDTEDTMHALRELRQQFDPAESANELVTNMIAASDGLEALHDDAAILGLAGEAANRPAVLHATAPSEPPSEEEFQNSCRRALEDLRQRYVGWRPRPLPEETPIGVSRELHDAALASYDRLLQPVRDYLYRRVLKLGEGKETPEAWRSLADGYLAHQARKDLTDWQELLSYTKRLANAEETPEPLDRLVSFLRQEQFPLPLETLIVQLPRKVADAAGRQVLELRPRAEHPLTIRLRKPDGEETTLSMLLTQSPPPTSTQDNRFHYVAIQPNPLSHGDLSFHPGDTMSATLKVFDQDGRPYVLSWTPAESRSAVYGFELLTRPPRLHLAEQTDPVKGSIAFGARLIFTEPERWTLPELMPR